VFCVCFEHALIILKNPLFEEGELTLFAVESLMGVDSGCTPDGGKAAAEELVANEQLVAIVGTTCSSAISEAMWIWDQAHIVFISPSATSDDLSSHGLDTFNRTSYSVSINPSDEPPADPASPAYKTFKTAFEAAYERECCMDFAAEAYDAAVILLQAIEAVSGVDSDGQLVIPLQLLAQTVRSISGYDGVSGEITFDADGNRVKE